MNTWMLLGAALAIAAGVYVVWESLRSTYEVDHPPPEEPPEERAGTG